MSPFFKRKIKNLVNKKKYNKIDLPVYFSMSNEKNNKISQKRLSLFKNNFSPCETDQEKVFKISTTKIANSDAVD